jgi:hypothetical protein
MPSVTPRPRRTETFAPPPACVSAPVSSSPLIQLPRRPHRFEHSNQARQYPPILPNRIMFGPSLNARSGFGWVSIKTRPHPPPPRSAPTPAQIPAARPICPHHLPAAAPNASRQISPGNPVRIAAVSHACPQPNSDSQKSSHAPSPAAAVHPPPWPSAPPAPSLAGDKNWPFLRFTTFPVAPPHGSNRSADTKMPESAGYPPAARHLRLRLRVHIRQHRHPIFPPDLFQHRQPRLQTRPAKRRRGGPVRLVETGFENVSDPQPLADPRQSIGHPPHSPRLSITQGPAIKSTAAWTSAFATKPSMDQARMVSNSRTPL